MISFDGTIIKTSSVNLYGPFIHKETDYPNQNDDQIKQQYTHQGKTKQNNYIHSHKKSDVRQCVPVRLATPVS